MVKRLFVNTFEWEAIFKPIMSCPSPDRKQWVLNAYLEECGCRFPYPLRTPLQTAPLHSRPLKQKCSVSQAVKGKEKWTDQAAIQVKDLYRSSPYLQSGQILQNQTQIPPLPHSGCWTRFHHPLPHPSLILSLGKTMTSISNNSKTPPMVVHS